MKFLLHSLFFLMLATTGSALSVVELTEGASVTGEVISERSDKVVLDLGFSVLSIPRDAIVSITGLEKPERELSEVDLFSVSTSTHVQSVKDWVDTLGGAVVLIRTGTGLGSGFFIRGDGYLVTNDHVIAGEHEVVVTVFEDIGSEFRRTNYENVRIVASSAEMDLALLKIEGVEEKQFPAIALGDSDALRQGQTVFAIGSPLGLERSVSQGIVSIKNRPVGGNLYIQTTTEINPGNSGGPLFNLKGEVVGVNNMKIVAMGAEGLGFAIPSSVLKLFLKNRDAFSFDPRNPNAGFRYNRPPSLLVKDDALKEE